MTDTAVLMTAIVEADYTLQTLSEATGIKDTLLCDKILGRADFTASEMMELRSVLNLDSELAGSIFLADTPGLL